MNRTTLNYDIKLKGASLADIAKVASDAISHLDGERTILSVKDVSGNSGAKTFICSQGNITRCIVKVAENKSIMNSHPNTINRVITATEVMREHGIAPKILIKGLDFHVELSAGTSVMKDFFHFNPELAPPEKLAKLLAKIHSAPTDWYDPLKEIFLDRDKNLGAIMRPIPSHAACWCLPWSGYDTGMPVLGVGNPDPNISKKILELELKTGVFKKVVGCQDFNPMSDAAKRQVVVHNDFKPDNVLRNPDTGDLTAIDYDLVQVGSAVMDFGLPYMMWLGSRYTTFQFRRSFIESYLLESGLPAKENNVKEMMLDCEVNTIVAFPGLLAKIYDAEVPLLRGVKHPTTKTGFEASDQNATPSGPELIDLLSTAIQKIRADEQLVDRCLRNGLVVTMFKEEAFGSKVLNSWLKEMQKNKMLRLFGIAETDNGEIYVAEHARN
jgi:hypothetical protein